MTLVHPTQAERCAHQFRQQLHPDGTHRTVSIVTIAEHMGGERSVRYDNGRKVICYTFDDDSSIESQGRGLAHQLRTLLP